MSIIITTSSNSLTVQVPTSVDLSPLKSGSTYPFSVAVTSSDARKGLTDAIDGRIMAAGRVKELLSVQDHANKVYVRAENCWAKDIDLTCCSLWNSGSGHVMAGTLISPRHIIFAAHYTYGSGTIVRFLTKASEIVERTVTGVRSIPDTDVAIAYLNENVPSSITFAKVLPKDFSSYISNNGLGLPSLCVDQEEKALIADVQNLNNTANPRQSVSLNVPQGNRSVFYEPKIGGDSGSPVFLVWQRFPILISCLNYGGAGSGPSYVYYREQIESIMKSFGSSYKMTDFNLAKVSGSTTIQFNGTVQ